jgi:hypothetical protein
VYRDRPRTLIELKTVMTAFVRNISQADLQKVFANKVKRAQACIEAFVSARRLPERTVFPNGR